MSSSGTSQNQLPQSRQRTTAEVYHPHLRCHHLHHQSTAPHTANSNKCVNAVTTLLWTCSSSSRIAASEATPNDLFRKSLLIRSKSISIKIKMISSNSTNYEVPPRLFHSVSTDCINKTGGRPLAWDHPCIIKPKNVFVMNVMNEI